MDWDRLFHSSMVTGIIMILVGLAWCVLAGVAILLLAVGEFAYYTAALAVWAGATYFYYKSGYPDS